MKLTTPAGHVGFRIPLALLALVIGVTLTLRAQEHPHPTTIAPVPLQPLALQARRLETTLQYLGQPLSDADRRAINDALTLSDDRAASTRLQEILDPHVLVTVHINPESRVSVEQGFASDPNWSRVAPGCSSSKSSTTLASPRL